MTAHAKDELRDRFAPRVLPCLVAAGMCLAVASTVATAASTEDGAAAGAEASDQSAISKYFKEWFERSDRAKESQPHWMTPVVTVTPRLEQEYRYDQLWQSRPKGVQRQNFGLNKGLELIPTEHTEVIISLPGYIKDSTSKGTEQGWADESFLLKLRLLSANEENGNYIVTAFLGATIPTGSTAFTKDQTVWTPTISAGKGWGTRGSGVDVQSTLSVSYGDVDSSQIGKPIVWNTAFQAHVFEKLWPEVEVNYTHFQEGVNRGKNETIITTGLIAGRYELVSRVKFVLGVGYQQAASDFRTFNHSWIITARAPF